MSEPSDYPLWPEVVVDTNDKGEAYMLRTWWSGFYYTYVLRRDGRHNALKFRSHELPTVVQDKALIAKLFDATMMEWLL